MIGHVWVGRAYWLAGISALLVLLTPPLAGQGQDDVLRRDQEQVMRRGERLRDLMTRLLERYRAEDRSTQVRLLENGLRHLQDSGVLEDVASIRDNLRDRALTDALRKQREVLADLEQLLAILRDRQSVENLEHEIDATTRLVDQASELLDRQTDLKERTRDQADAEPTEAERAAQKELADLARQQKQEADRNAREAGLKAPFLEQALQRVERLLQRQADLEARVAKPPDAGAGDPAAEDAFRLGAIDEGLRALSEATRRQQDMERLAEAARAAQESAEDPSSEAARQAARELRSQLEQTAAAHDPALSEAAGEFERAAGEAPPKDLAAAAGRIEEAAREQAKQAAAAAAREQRAQIQAMREAARAPEGKEATGSEATLQRAAEALQEAARLSEEHRDAEALTRVSEASRLVAQAREQQRGEHPDAQRLAGEMASESAGVAQDLRRTPDGDATSERAAQQLEHAEQDLRATATKVGGATPPESTPPELEAARRDLEAARDALNEALSAETAGREQSLAASAQRQQDLLQRTQQVREQLQAQQEGLTQAQREGAAEAMRQAEQQMQQAAQALQQGAQSTAAGHQEQAAQELADASEALQRNRPLTAEQKQALADLAKEQEQLEQDIMQLAKLAEERKNHGARQALQQAASAAERARKAMEDGDREEADAAQQQAKEQLEEAKKQLEEERDRYQDLRQEELLFRIKDELVAFLEKQKPITADTERTAGEIDAGSRLSRRLRRELNDLGEKESDLAAKADYIRSALEEEGTLVFTHVLRSNQEDLQTVAERLSGRAPDPGELTVMLQHDVERRTTELLEALQREQQRRRENANNGNQGQQPGSNNMPDGRPRLVPVLAELQMLKQMEQELLERTQHMQELVAGRGDAVTDLELSLVDRLANRHHAVTQIFLQLKSELEQAMQGPGEGSGEGGDSGKPKEGEGR